MVFIHIDKKDDAQIKKLDDFLNHKKVFLLIYMEGCGPCNATRPEWKKLKNVLTDEFINRDDVAVVDINTEFTSDLKHIKDAANGFPTMRFYENNEFQNYEDSDVEKKDRSVDSFVEWIELKLGDKNISKSREQKGGYTLKRKRRRSKTKKNRSRKWSRKYKKSINCRRPKGFSQKQYCKYGRKK